MDAERWAQVKTILEEVRERRVDERGAYLDDACGGDADLRAEVESLIAHGERGEEFLTPPGSLTLEPDTELGPYRIESSIGAGGMGEVYRAKDTRLGRTVAIKVLPVHLSGNAELRARFEREARAVSSLNHPHICTLHDVGHQDGVDYLVMEYIEGETLDDRLTKGPMKIDQALELAVQIAEALLEAHRAGIVHRDLKPGNMMITKSGAKVLDFGLARIVDKQPATRAADARKQQRDLTEERAIIGTVQYMAPEQLEGTSADARTDIFAFGAVVYEMLTGRRAFEGESRASLMAAILEHEPEPISALRPTVPSLLNRVVTICLAKDPDERWQTFQDLKRELLWIREGSERDPNISRVESRRSWFSAAVLLAAVAAAGLLGLSLRAPTISTSAHLLMDLVPSERLSFRDTYHRPSGTAFAISPDGRNIVFSGWSGDRAQLYRRVLDQERAVAIAGTDGAVHPFFSPDGQWVAFFSDGLLKKVPLDGGATVTLCDVTALDPERVDVPPSALLGWGHLSDNFYGGSWGDDDNIVFALVMGGLLRVSSSGGEPSLLTTLDKDGGENSHRLPHVLPGSDAVLFTIVSPVSGDPGRVAVESLRTGERRTLVDEGSDARFVSTGHVLYMNAGTLMAAPFDLGQLELTGSAVPMIENVMHAFGSTRPGLESLAAQVSVSDEGTLVFLGGGLYPELRRYFQWVDRSGNSERLDVPGRHYLGVRLSPDEQRIAVGIGPSTMDVAVIDLTRGTSTRLTTVGTALFPIWSPDGTRIAFGDRTGGSAWRRADMGGDIEPLTQSEHWHVPTSWTPDGQSFVLVETNPATGHDILLASLDLGVEPKPLLATPANESHPEISPDGRWLAYASTESGEYEVYVQSFPDGGERHQISAGGGLQPLWSKSGDELFYRRDEQVMSVSIQTQPGFVAGRSQLLFEREALQGAPARSYDITAEGERFLMIGQEPIPDAPLTHLNVVLGWADRLMHVNVSEN